MHKILRNTVLKTDRAPIVKLFENTENRKAADSHVAAEFWQALFYLVLRKRLPL